MSSTSTAIHSFTKGCNIFKCIAVFNFQQLFTLLTKVEGYFNFLFAAAALQKT